MGSLSIAQFESAKKTNEGDVRNSFAPLLMDEGGSSGGGSLDLEKIKEADEELSRKLALIEKEKRS